MSLQYVDAQGRHFVRGVGQPDFTDEEKKELAKLKSKYSDLIKKRQDRMNKKPQRGG